MDGARVSMSCASGRPVGGARSAWRAAKDAGAPMLNFLSKFARSTADCALPPGADVDGTAQTCGPKKGCIADVQLMGASAIATLTVTELTRGSGETQLAELLDELMQSGATDFVLDVQNVQYMDSACLGCLVAALNAQSARGGHIAMVNADRSVQYLFRLTRLDRVFPICTDVLSALSTLERLKGRKK
jgi:anti-sigma B factor antagonist